MEPALCPRDGSRAVRKEQKGRLRRFFLDVCPECGGVWFDKGEIAKVTRSRELERSIVDFASGDGGIDCPRCGNRLALRPIGSATVDVCPSCGGTWFDVGELEVAARTLAGDVVLVESAPLRGLARSEALALAAFTSTGSLKKLLKPPQTRRYRG